MTSTSIYTDQKNYPYVYRLDNPITNEFYIGYRKANKFQSEQDLGTDYFTSAPAIKERFNEFQSTIIAEFFDPNDAYDYEQYLIYCDLGNPLMLNKRCHYGKARFNCIGKIVTNETRRKKSEIQTGRSHSDETRAKMSAAKKGKSHSDETRAKLSAAKKGKPSPNKGKSHSDETRAKMSASQKGRSPSDETRAKLSASQKGRSPSDETRAKLSAAKKGKPSPTKGKVWWNNGTTNCKAKTQPSSDHTRGRLKKGKL